MNTSGDQKTDVANQPPLTGKIIFPEESIPKSEEQINELQEQVQDGKDRFHELMFLFIIFIIIAFDVLAIPVINSVLGTSFIIFLELIALIILARRCGVEEIQIFLIAMLKKIMGDGPKKE